MLSEHDIQFEKSQEIRVAALNCYKEAGDALIELRRLLSGATKTNPVETDLGTYTSFEHLLKSDRSPARKTSAYQAIKLAENWDIVVALGMQDTTNPETLRRCMRVSRTIKVIDWAKAKMATGVPLSELKFEHYWEDEEAARQYRLAERQAEQDLRRDTAQAAVDYETHQQVVTWAKQLEQELDHTKQKANALEQELDHTKQAKDALEARCKQLEDKLVLREAPASSGGNFDALALFKAKHRESILAM
jgi:FtsZ-binding cell division protein ZapB